MNDFTKDDLSILWRSLNHMLEIKYFIQPTTFELLNKLQSMIDNYDKYNQELAYLDLLNKYQDAAR